MQRIEEPESDGGRRWRPWKAFSLRTKGVLILLIPLAPLIAAVFLLQAEHRQDRQAAEVVTRLATERNLTRQIVVTVLNAESAVYGYMLAEDESYLDALETAETTLPTLFARLRESAEDSHGGRVDRVVRQVDRMMVIMGRLRESEAREARAGSSDEDEGAADIREDQLIRLSQEEIDQLLLEVDLLIGEIQDELSQAEIGSESEVQDTIRTTWLAVVSAIAGGLVAMVVFTQGIVKRVGAAVVAARHLPHGQSLGEVPGGGDEVGALGVALRETKAILDDHEVTRHANEVALRAARDEAEVASRAKSAFLSRMSHELRTPLNAILGFAQLLRMEELDEEQQGDVDEILKAGGHLSASIKEVIDIAEVESGTLQVALGQVDVDPLVSETLEEVRPLAEKRRIDTSVSPSVAGATVVADRDKLKRVLVHLVSNAVNYNVEGGRVDVSVTRELSRTLIHVKDTGPGLAAEEIELAFSPFERLGAERSQIPGTGLGLSVSRRLVGSMDGTITVESSKGHGSTFIVDLPTAS